MSEKQTLRLLNETWKDILNGQVLWQVLALLCCLGLAWLLARWWRARRLPASVSGVLGEANGRLAFPLAAMLLIAVARPLLQPHMHVNLLSIAQPLLGSLALVRTILLMLRRAFPAATWLATSERLLGVLIWGGVALYITDLAPWVIEALEQVAIPVGRQRLDLWMLLHGLVTVLLTVLVALWLAGLVEQRLMGASELDSSLRIVLVRIAKALLTVAALLSSLSLVGIDMTALSVFTGALGVGLGFGLQKIASNYVSGFIILLDHSIKLGNVIQVDAATGGVVTQITTRFTVLRNLTGVEFIVPNETLVGQTIQNQSYSDPRVRATISIGIGYRSDVEQAMALLVSTARAHPRVLAEPPPRALLASFGDSAINLELGFWIADPENGTLTVRSDLNLAVWKAFQQAGIDIPYPQREVRLLTDAGNAKA